MGQSGFTLQSDFKSVRVRSFILCGTPSAKAPLASSAATRGSGSRDLPQLCRAIQQRATQPQRVAVEHRTGQGVERVAVVSGIDQCGIDEDAAMPLPDRGVERDVL